MKRNEVMAIIATSLMLFALCLSASAKDRNRKVINYSTRIDDDNNRKPTVTVCPERPTPPTLVRHSVPKREHAMATVSATKASPYYIIK